MDIPLAPSPSPSPAGSRRARRRSRRPSRSGNENSAPLNKGASRAINRFGFKQRRLPAADAPAPEEDQAASLRGAPVDVLALIEGAFGDLDAAQALLKLKPTAGQFEFKAKIAELQDVNKQLKAGLSDNIKRCRAIGEALAPAQEEVNGRLTALAEQLVGERAATERLRADLDAAQTRNTERSKQVSGLREEVEGAKRRVETLLGEAEAATQRADAAEDTGRQQSAEIGTLRAELDELRAACDAHVKAAAEAARKAEESEAAHATERAEAERVLQELKQSAASREQELSAECTAAAASARELQASLAATSAERDGLAAAKESLGREHAALSETCASKSADVERLRAELESTSAQLRQKDVDLRESIQSFTAMQRENTEQLNQERARVRQLDGELQELRGREAKLSSDLQQAAHEVERSAAEIAAAKGRVAELQASLERSEAESIAASNKLSVVAEKAERAEKEAAQLGAALEQTRASLAAAEKEAAQQGAAAEALTQGKHELEVEFRSYKEHHGTSNAQQMEAITDLKLTVDRLSNQVETKQSELGTTQGNLAQQEGLISSLQQKLIDADRARREMHNAIQELKGNIRVFCRLRPPPDGAPMAVAASEESGRLTVTHGGDAHGYSFDKIFGPSSSQASVFAEVEGLVQSSLDGYKVCIFAYGQTGSGKTFTMQGTEAPPSWGLIPRSLSMIFESASAMRADGWEWSIEASFLEIYNEAVRDLLHTGGGPQLRHDIQHEEAWGTVVTNMSRVEVTTMEQIAGLMGRAAKARAVGATSMNAQSSRSHSVFALYLRGVNGRLNTELHGALHLVDLAGSERLSKSGATGERLKETQNINKSLSSLADVFAAKAEKRGHTPFRNSKLTHLMEPCLSGHGKTLMVVNVGPEEDNSHETLCSLRFASQVSQCDTGGKPKRSAKPAGAASAPRAAAAPKHARPHTAGASVSSKRAK